MPSRQSCFEPRTLCVALAAGFSVSAQATTDLTALSLEQLLEVTVVGASKYEQKQSKVAAAVSVITRSEIQAFGWRTVAEALASLPHDGGNLAIVRAILSIADSLGFSVTAEGVETAEQAAALAEMECDLLQGYFIGRPVVAAEMPIELARTDAGHVAPAVAAKVCLETPS